MHPWLQNGSNLDAYGAGGAIPHEFGELLVMGDGVSIDRVEVACLSRDFGLETVERDAIFGHFLGDRGDDFGTLGIVIEDPGSSKVGIFLL